MGEKTENQNQVKQEGEKTSFLLVVASYLTKVDAYIKKNRKELFSLDYCKKFFVRNKKMSIKFVCVFFVCLVSVMFINVRCSDKNSTLEDVFVNDCFDDEEHSTVSDISTDDNLEKEEHSIVSDISTDDNLEEEEKYFIEIGGIKTVNIKGLHVGMRIADFISIFNSYFPNDEIIKVSKSNNVIKTTRDIAVMGGDYRINNLDNMYCISNKDYDFLVNCNKSGYVEWFILSKDHISKLLGVDSSTTTGKLSQLQEIFMCDNYDYEPHNDYVYQHGFKFNIDKYVLDLKKGCSVTFFGKQSIQYHSSDFDSQLFALSVLAVWSYQGTFANEGCILVKHPEILKLSDEQILEITKKENIYKGGQLWKNGPYWAATNIGADKPEDCGYYFWWGDTVGYKLENDQWVASDGSSSNFSFEEANAPTYDKDHTTLQSEGWITSDSVLAPEHDAARAHLGENWRMPTDSELQALCDNCTWTWTTVNGVKGYVVKGRDNYSGASIFLPAAGYGYGTSLYYAGSLGYYWSSFPYSGNGCYFSWSLYFRSSYHCMDYYNSRYLGRPVRPVSDVH